MKRLLFIALFLGTLNIGKAQIEVSTNPEKNRIKKAYQKDGMLSAHYFVGQSAYPIEKGAFYYQNHNLFLHELHYGVSRYFSVGIGMLSASIDGLPLWVSPKLSLPIVENKLSLTINGKLGRSYGSKKTPFYGIGFAGMTLGSHTKNITVGVGYAIKHFKIIDAPIIAMSGMLRIGKRTHLISENYILKRSFETERNGKTVLAHEWKPAISFGGRHTWDRLSLNYGLGMFYLEFLTTQNYVALPWLGLTVPLSKIKE